MTIKVSSAKAKGRRLQQWVAQQIANIIGLECGADKPIESRPMGQHGVDIRLEKKALRRFPFSVECKAQESWAVPNWIKQARENRIKGTMWLLIAKRSRDTPVVIMEAEDFFKLYLHAMDSFTKKKRSANI